MLKENICRPNQLRDTNNNSIEEKLKKSNNFIYTFTNLKAFNMYFQIELENKGFIDFFLSINLEKNNLINLFY